LHINADRYTPVDSTFMTTGAIDSVKNTANGFYISQGYWSGYKQIRFYFSLKTEIGFDHNWVLNTAGDAAILAAKVTSPASGISLEVYTNEPGIQVYTGNFLDGTVTGKKGIVYKQRTGICLETQHYPDSPNKLEWPSVILEPGQNYYSKCVYKFGVEK